VSSLSPSCLGVLDVALPVARNAVIDPGISPARRQLQRGSESALRIGMIAQRRPGLAVCVMRLRPVRRGVTCVARGLERGQRISGGGSVQLDTRICMGGGVATPPA
jgi:hypothetical protein